MAKVILSISMSLDGFVAGPNVSPQQPLGENGMRLHDWIFDGKTDADTKIMEELMIGSGAVIAGRRTYDVGIDGGWGGSSPFTMPVIIISKSLPSKLVHGFNFINGIEKALDAAKAIAGDKDVWVMGGANIAQQFISAKFIDELQINLAPLLLGGGSRLFENLNDLTCMERIRAIQTPAATHLKYRMPRRN